jgi:hypothetical protein
LQRRLVQSIAKNTGTGKQAGKTSTADMLAPGGAIVVAPFRPLPSLPFATTFAWLTQRGI